MGHAWNKTLFLAALIFVAPACKTKDSNGLSTSQVALLSEDVEDIMDIAFAAGEGAYYGDEVSPRDIIEEASPANGFIVTYDLPRDFRPGLGFGDGRVRLAVKEDGRYIDHPEDFRLATTTAVDVVIEYEIAYRGETDGRRDTDVVFLVTLTAARRSEVLPFSFSYTIEGDGYLDDTHAEFSTWLESDGAPDRRIWDLSDGEGKIDDPDASSSKLDFDIDYRSDGSYVGEGWVGCCRWFRESFR